MKDSTKDYSPEELAKAFLVDCWQNGDEQIARSIMSQDVVRRHARNPGKGLEKYLAMIRSFRNAFPGFTNAILHVVGDSNSLAVHYKSSGRQCGWWGSIPPCFRAGEIEALDIYKLRDGLIFEIIPMWDELAMVTQMGLYSVNPLYFIKNLPLAWFYKFTGKKHGDL